MKNALILHGAGNNSNGNWFPWLKQELETKGYKVWVPDLPNSDVPIQHDWLHTIFSSSDWEFNEHSVMAGHSSGGTLILRILEKLPGEIKVNKAVLVAAPVELGSKPEYYGYKKDLVANPFNWVKIKSSCKQFYFVYSNNDKYECGISQGKILQKNLGGELIIKPDQGHFNLEVNSSYTKFPFLLKLIA